MEREGGGGVRGGRGEGGGEGSGGGWLDSLSFIFSLLQQQPHS